MLANDLTLCDIMLDFATDLRALPLTLRSHVESLQPSLSRFQALYLCPGLPAPGAGFCKARKSQKIDQPALQ